jgi:hypothetical protein
MKLIFTIFILLLSLTTSTFAEPNPSFITLPKAISPTNCHPISVDESQFSLQKKSFYLSIKNFDYDANISNIEVNTFARLGISTIESPKCYVNKSKMLALCISSGQTKDILVNTIKIISHPEVALCMSIINVRIK